MCTFFFSNAHNPVYRNESKKVFILFMSSILNSRLSRRWSPSFLSSPFFLQLYFHTWQRDSWTFQNPDHNNRSLAISVVHSVIRGPIVTLGPMIWSFLPFLLPPPAVKLSAVSPCSLPSSYSCRRSVITPAGILCAPRMCLCVYVCDWVQCQD